MAVQCSYSAFDGTAGGEPGLGQRGGERGGRLQRAHQSHAAYAGAGQQEAADQRASGLDHPADPDSSQVLETATTRRTEWLRVYRDTWGFVSLILRQTSD